MDNVLYFWNYLRRKKKQCSLLYLQLIAGRHHKKNWSHFIDTTQCVEQATNISFKSKKQKQKFKFAYVILTDRPINYFCQLLRENFAHKWPTKAFHWRFSAHDTYMTDHTVRWIAESKQPIWTPKSRYAYAKYDTWQLLVALQVRRKAFLENTDADFWVAQQQTDQKNNNFSFYST